LNTPRLATDATGEVVWRWGSDAFGVGEADTDPDSDTEEVNVRLRFPGQYLDEEAGLHYNYFRDYDPVTGRYVESDPIGLAAGVNTYGYVGENPVSFVDPFGLRVLNPHAFPVSPDVMAALREFNQLIGCDKDVVITGGNRPPDSKFGAGPNSPHAKGLAADIYVPGQQHIVTANQAIRSELFGGVGWYEEGYRGPNNEGPHTHVDLRPRKPDGSMYLWGYRANGEYGSIPQYDVQLNPNNCGCEQ
jgi:RHS repeat-associated protein